MMAIVLSASFNKTLPPNAQAPVFQATITNASLFAASPNVSIVDPGLRTPYVLESNLQIERELAPNTTPSVGTVWTHGVHLIASSTADLDLIAPTRTTTYIACPAGAAEEVLRRLEQGIGGARRQDAE